MSDSTTRVSIFLDGRLLCPAKHLSFFNCLLVSGIFTLDAASDDEYEYEHERECESESERVDEYEHELECETESERVDEYEHVDDDEGLDGIKGNDDFEGIPDLSWLSVDDE